MCVVTVQGKGGSGRDGVVASSPVIEEVSKIVPKRPGAGCAL